MQVYSLFLFILCFIFFCVWRQCICCSIDWFLVLRKFMRLNSIFQQDHESTNCPRYLWVVGGVENRAFVLDIVQPCRNLFSVLLRKSFLYFSPGIWVMKLTIQLSYIKLESPEQAICWFELFYRSSLTEAYVGDISHSSKIESDPRIKPDRIWQNGERSWPKNKQR